MPSEDKREREAEKTFSCEICLTVKRTDKEKVLFTAPLGYPNCTRSDIVAIQDVVAQMVVKLVDLGYASVEGIAPKEEVEALHALRARIRQ